MCVKISVPAIAGARLVVSDKGDILSPKYAPEIIAPAVNPTCNPRACPIPIKAIPIVPVVDQELPVVKETIQQTIHAAKRKIFGFRTCNP